MQKALLASFVFAILFSATLGSAQTPATADTAFSELIAGRYFRAGFPAAKTRDTLVNQYLAFPGDTDYVQPPAGNFPGPVPPSATMPGHLENAIDQAVLVKTSGAASGKDKLAAKYIAWQGLDAYLEGQLYAGNRDLLSGLRVAFPSTNGNSGALPPRPVPFGMPVNADGQDYYGANILDVVYARNQFFTGTLKALDFLVSDPDGKLQGSDGYQGFPYYTGFDDSRSANLPFPRFKDGDFANAQAQLVDGYLLGQVLDRYGKAVNSIGQRLWTAAYFDKERSPGGTRNTERPAMLTSAEAELKKGIHNQFLALLPLAASLSEDDYQTGRLYQVNNDVTASETLMEHIQNGDIPKLDDRSLERSITAINSQIGLVASAKSATATLYGTAQTKINQRDQAGVLQQQNEFQLRTQLQSQLLSLTGIDPSAFNNLATQADMDAYRAAVSAALSQAINAGINDPYLAKGADIPTSALNLLLAKNDIDVARAEIQSIPQQIQVEEQRNSAVATITTSTGSQVRAYDLAIASLQAIPDISITNGTFTGITVDLTKVVTSISTGVLNAQINRALENKEVQIGDINSRATVENLLIRENVLAGQFISTVARAQLAAANLNSLVSKVNRLLDDHVYYQQSTDNLWYQNPTLVFDQEQAEKDYQDSLSDYTNKLYTLSQMLGAAWSEPYQNPYSLADGFTNRLVGSTGTEYADFTMPESVFNVYRYQEGDNFFSALKEWDTALRGDRVRPGNNLEQSTTLSLRQDMLGFSDLKWDPANQQFNVDPVARLANINKFRGYLLRLKSQTDPNYFLRLEFPVTYYQRRDSRTASVAGGDFTPFALQRDVNSWNERLTKAAVQFVGNNVSQAPSINVTVAQFGKVAIPTYAPPPPQDQPLIRQQKTLNLPEYYYDPENNPAFPDNFRLDIGATLGNQQPSLADVSNKFMSPFCDKYILLIRQAAQQSVVNIQNIEDINVTFYWIGAGVPPAFSGW